MNRHTLQVLEFQRMLEIPAAEAQSFPGKRRIRSLFPLESEREIAERQARIAEMSRLLQDEPKWPVLNLEDPDPVLEKLRAEGVILEPHELVELSRVVDLSVACLRILHKASAAERFPLLRAEVDACWGDGEISKRVRATFDARGEVLDDASPALRKIRRRLNNLRQETAARAEKILHGMGQIREGVENFVTLRSGRYVVAVPAEMVKRLPGILHDRSATGRTHVLEPMDLVEANNGLTDLETQEREEIRRILLELTDVFRGDIVALRETCRALGEIDALGGIARWMHGWKATLPAIDASARSLRLVEARHPLLCKALGSVEAVVPLQLEMGPSLRCVVVSGPNMGGKSVLLRTVGSTVALALTGLPVLAREGTEIPLADDILVDIGDEQSMDSDLSTFAGHLQHLRVMDEAATDRTIMLIDELGSGTDPQEGAALGLALLTELHSRGGFALVTTHMSPFKDFAAQTAEVGNGSMEFDRETLRPKYRFVPDIPGRSHAFEVAALQGWRAERMEDAARRLEESGRRSDALLRELEDLRAELGRQREEMERRREDVEGARRRYENMVQKLKARLDKIRLEKSMEEDQALRELRTLRSRLQTAIERAQNQAAPAAASTEGKEAIREADASLRRRRRHRGVRRAERPKVPVEKLEPGREFWCESFRANVKLESVVKDRAWVRAGSMRVEVPVGTLSEPDATAHRPKLQKLPDVVVNRPPVGTELDLRGLSAEECLRELDQYMDRAILEGLGRVRIIHGIGKGILKQTVAEYLKRSEHITGSRDGEPGEGGPGVTIAFFREPKG